MTYNLVDFPRDPAAFLWGLHSAFGDLASLETQGRQVVFVFSPELNQTVLSQPDLFHSMFFPVRGSRRSAQRRVTSGLLSMNGPEHRADRRSLKPIFSRDAIMRYLAPVAEMTDEFLADWQPGDVRDLAAEMTQLALRITSSILFGLEDLTPAVKLGELVEDWVSLNHRSGISAFLATDDAHQHYEGLLAQAEQIERELLELIAERRGGAEARTRHDILSILAGRRDAEELTDEQVIGHTALLFAAAHMTTAHSLTWTLLLLAQHPQIADQLRASDEDFDPTRIASVGESASLWDRVIKESMRVLPASSYSQRVAQTETRLGEVTCRAGASVVFSQFVTHRRADLYRDADSFLPDRWQTLAPSPYAYLPFGAGPRMCLGGPLALAEMKVILPRIMRRFALKLVEEEVVDAQIISTMLSPVTPVMCQLLEANEPGETAFLRGKIAELVRFPEPGTRGQGGSHAGRRRRAQDSAGESSDRSARSGGRKSVPWSLQDSSTNNGLTVR